MLGVSLPSSVARPPICRYPMMVLRPCSFLSSGIARNMGGAIPTADIPALSLLRAVAEAETTWSSPGVALGRSLSHLVFIASNAGRFQRRDALRKIESIDPEKVGP